MKMNTPTPWTNGDSALLDELLAFLEDAPTHEELPPDDTTSVSSRSDCSSPSPLPLISPLAPPKPTQQPPRRTSNSGGASSVKRTLDQLRAEAHLLTEELERLRCRGHQILNAAVETAQNERFKRRRAERECQQLRDAVYAQTQFIRGLRTVFTIPPSFSSGLNLCHHLHNYTRLPSDRSTRWSEYAAMAQETRLRTAMDILCRETESLTCSDDESSLILSTSSPLIQTELLTDENGFGVTTTSVFALETKDLSSVMRGACVAVRDIVSKCQSYKCTSMRKMIVDPDSSSSFSSNINYRVVGVHHQSRVDSDELSIESRIVTLYKQTEDYAVVLWDFVDDDELHPEGETTDITRQAVGACLIRREICADGVERTMYRALSTRRYRFHENAQDESLRRFEHLTATTMQQNELIFRGIMLESIAKEEAAYAHAVGRLGSGISSA